MVRTAGPKKRRRDDFARIIAKSRGSKLREELYHKSNGELSDGPSIGERPWETFILNIPLALRVLVTNGHCRGWNANL